VSYQYVDLGFLDLVNTLMSNVENVPNLFGNLKSTNTVVLLGIQGTKEYACSLSIPPNVLGLFGVLGLSG
jgi:hypothetical protein